MTDKLEDFNASDGSGDEDEQPKSKNKPLYPTHNKYIKNKVLRNTKYQDEKRQKKKAKKQERRKRQQDGGPKILPHTLETLRVKDETHISQYNVEQQQLLKFELEHDEFSDYFKNTYEPKVLITTSENPHLKTHIFARELKRIVPNAVFISRKRSSIKKMTPAAIERGFTDILIINENQKQPNGLLVIHLPNGPTAHFKLSNVKITKEMRKSSHDFSKHKPEVILNHFSTQLGITVSRMLASLFHYRPEFKGQRAVAFHNQRDFIFFRHYRYNFDEEGKRTRLKELGPRFTLKLRSLQKGTFDSITGMYIWSIEGRRHEFETSRRKFYL